MPIYRFAKYSFIVLVFLTLLTPLIMFRDLLYPLITSKAFYFRTLIDLALPFYLYLIISNRELRPSLKHPLTLGVLVFVLLSLVSAFFGVDFTRSFWGMFERMDSVYTLMHLALFYFYVLFLAKISGAHFEYFLKAWVWVSGITAINGIVGFLGGPTLAPDSSLPDRASSTLGNPIFFASFLVFPTVLSAFFALRAESRKEKGLYWLVFVLHVLALIFSGTRGVVVGFAGGIFLAAIFYIIFQTGRRTRVIGISVLAALAIAAVLTLSFGQKLPSALNIKRLLTFNDSNTQARLIQWQIALKGVKDNFLFGVGPNNYYVVSNKYYNPKIWQYDKGWFDKPHNYQLEVLVTTGILGLLAYLTIIVLALGMFYRAFKAGLLSLFETSILGAGFLAYQIQNLFVFDTVSASVMFYLVLAFAAFLRPEGKNDSLTAKKNSRSSGGIAQIFLWAGAPIMLYAAFAANWTGGQISRDLNIAKLFQSDNFDVAKTFLDRAANSPFNFYLRDTAYEYSNFAAWWSNRNQPADQLAKSKAMMADALRVQETAVKSHPSDPAVWMKYGNTLFAQSHLENWGFNQKAYDAGEKAYELVPKRPDPKLFMAQVAIEGKKNDLAEKWLDEVLADYPDHLDAKWQLADIYYFSARQQQAEKLAMDAVAGGYRLERIVTGDWLLTFYYDSKQPQKALDFLLTQLSGHEKDVKYFERLADAYMKSGRFVEARGAALKVVELDPASKADVDAFLKALPR